MRAQAAWHQIRRNQATAKGIEFNVAINVWSMLIFRNKYMRKTTGIYGSMLLVQNREV